MVQVDLKTLLANHDKDSLEETLQALYPALCIQDAEGNLVLGKKSSGQTKQPIKLNNDVIGWVMGKEKEAKVAAQLIGAEAKINQMALLEKDKDQWFYTAAHDLKAPLGLIIGYAGLLQDGGTIPSEEDLGFLEEIKNAGLRMNQLVLEVLDLMRIEGGTALHLEAIALKQVLGSAITELKLRIKAKNLRFSYAPPKDDLFLTLDPILMQQVLVTLLDNAIKFTPEDGEISLKTKTYTDSITITVSDTGVGIPADDLPKIFNKFHKVQRGIEPNRTSGLKMAIAKAIVKGHKGDIRLTSVEGEGTMVVIVLPLKA